MKLFLAYLLAVVICLGGYLALAGDAQRQRLPGDTLTTHISIEDTERFGSYEPNPCGMRITRTECEATD